MKTKFKLLISLCSTLILSSCTFFPTTSSSITTSRQSENSSEIISSSSISNNEENSSSSDAINNRKFAIDLYSINDLHGRINENSNENAPGISKLTTYLKKLKSKNPDGYVFLSAGDTFQDTYESGENNGNLLAEWLDISGCEAMALGNHEFDWGQDALLKNKNLAKSCAFLGANIIDTSTNKNPSLCDSYKIIERNNIKIGIIGTIGSTQFTSICSPLISNLDFLNTTDIVKNLSDELRAEKGCDVVVWLNHADYEHSDPEAVTQVSPVSNKKYVDAVFNAHTHNRENYPNNGVYFSQGYAHGSNISHIKLELLNNNIVSSSYSYSSYYDICDEEEDLEVEKLKEKYYTKDYYTTKDTVLGNITGYPLISRPYAGKILAKATYDLYPEQMKNVDIVINNGARNSGVSGPQTKETLFNMMPFTNTTYIVSGISGRDINNELNYNYGYSPSLTKFEYNKTYTVAVIDYLLLHIDENKHYNYFPSYKEENIISKIDEYSVDILCNYLKKEGTINLKNFDTSNYLPESE